MLINAACAFLFEDELPCSKRSSLCGIHQQNFLRQTPSKTAHPIDDARKRV